MFRSYYVCPQCKHEWTDEWSATSDDDCPNCGARHISPTESEDKYMAKGRRGPSRGWRTFLHNHADGIVAMDLFVVPKDDGVRHSFIVQRLERAYR